MMGERTVMQKALFQRSNIERHVPANHLLRSLERFVDISGRRSHLKPFYDEIDRPSIDLKLMNQLMIGCYCFARNGGCARGASQSRLSLVLPTWAGRGC